MRNAAAEVGLEFFRKIGDPEADADLEQIWQALNDKQRRDLIATLGRWEPGSDPLPTLIAKYIDRPFDVPDTIAKRILAAQQAYALKHSAGGSVVLGACSLPLLYLEPEISLTLATTGRLMTHIRSRLEDTQAFLDGVMKPGSLVVGGDGQKWVRKIRLTHAAIRKVILDARKSQDERKLLAFLPSTEIAMAWQSRVWGPVEDQVPLDQVELALVLQTFAWVMVDGLQKMGWPMSASEAENHIQAWSAIGSMLGVDPRLLPAGEPALPAAKALYLRIRGSLLARGDPLGPDASDRKDTWLSGRLLTSALITVLAQIAREHMPVKYHWLLTNFPRVDEALQQIPRVLIRRLLGEEASRQLRIGHVAWFDRLVCWVGMKLIDPRDVAKHKGSGESDSMSIGTLI